MVCIFWLLFISPHLVREIHLFSLLGRVYCSGLLSIRNDIAEDILGCALWCTGAKLYLIWKPEGRAYAVRAVTTLGLQVSRECQTDFQRLYQFILFSQVYSLCHFLFLEMPFLSFAHFS